MPGYDPKFNLGTPFKDPYLFGTPPFTPRQTGFGLYPAGTGGLDPLAFGGGSERRGGGGSGIGDILGSLFDGFDNQEGQQKGNNWLVPAVALGGSLLSSIFGGEEDRPKGSRTTTTTRQFDPVDIFSRLGVTGSARTELDKILAEALIGNLTELMGGTRYVPRYD